MNEYVFLNVQKEKQTKIFIKCQWQLSQDGKISITLLVIMVLYIFKLFKMGIYLYLQKKIK